MTKLKEPQMEQNPAYEEIKCMYMCAFLATPLPAVDEGKYHTCQPLSVCYGHNIALKKSTAYESSKLQNKDFSMGQNPSYGQVGQTVYS